MQLKNLFFSYSRADGADFAERLAVDLQKDGFNVWIDQQDIRAGSEWDLEIEKALETCDCLLFIESEKSVISTNVLDEVYYALEQNKRVIPLVLVDSKTPFRLKRLQHINFSSDYDRGLAHLVQELNGVAVHPLLEPTATFTPPAQKLPQPVYKRRPVVLGGLAFISIIAILGYAYFSTDKKRADSDQPIQLTVRDTLKETNDTLARPVVGTADVDPPIEIEKKISTKPVRGKSLSSKSSTPGITKPAVKPQAEAGVSNVTSEVALVPEHFAGTWQLSSVAAPARGHRGYLNIEAVGDTKIKVLSTFQFSFVRANDTAYFEVFNGFAGCASCTINKEISIVDNDVAFGAQIYKILRTDVAGEGKKGDTVMMAGPNKSINATVSLQLFNRKSALIRVHRSSAVPMSYGMVIPAFDYTFRFTRKDF